MRALLLSLAAAGCSSGVEVLIDSYAAEVEVGAILLFSSGELVAISELEKATLGTFLFEVEERDADELVFVGYRAADIAGEDSAIRPAQEGEPRLPAPIYSAAGDWTGERRPELSRPVESIPPLTSDAITACPSLATERSPSVMRCSIRSCRPELSERACFLEIDAQPCGLGAARGRIDPDGSIAFEPSDTLGRCAVVPPGPLEARALECIDDMLICRVSIYPERTPSLLDSTRIALAEPVETLDKYTSYYERLGDVVRAGDRMAVLMHRQPESIDCAAAPPSELRFFGLDGTQVATATVAPCTWRIAASSDRIVGAEGAGAALSLYDLNGRRIARQPVEPVGGFPAALAVEGDSIVSSWLQTAGPNRIALHSLDTLAQRWIFETDSNEIRDVVMSGEDRIFVLDAAQSSVVLYDVDGARLGSSQLNSTTPAVTDLILLPERSELLATAGGTGSAGVYSLNIDLVSTPRNAPSPETDAQAHALSPWPADRSRVLVSMRDRNDSSALAALYDLQSGLIVPGAAEIGSGPSRSSAIDPLGRVWISMAWAGELAIVAPE